MKQFKISVVVPAFNEEQVLPETVRRLTDVLSAYPNYEIIFVDDGSSDNTLAVLKKARDADDRIHYVALSRNFGHQYALRAGLAAATGDCVISIDADLQHPPHLIPKLIEQWQNGFEIVYTTRQETAKTPFFKRLTSRLFYRLFSFLSGLNLPAGTADFRLVDRKVADVLVSMRERTLFLRGVIFWMGFKQMAVPYRVEPRFAGQSHYTVRKMLSLALMGATSFSTKPLRLAVYGGLFVTVLGFLFICYVFYMRLFAGGTITGWASVLSVMLILGGTQLFMMGIIGEYIGMIFMETKNRPTYLVRETSLEEKR